VKYANLALAFLLELAGLAAFGYWGFVVPDGLVLKLVAGLGLPILAAVVWGLFAAHKASVRLPAPGKLAVQLGWFAAAAVALALAGRVWLGVALFLLYVVNRVLAYLWHQ
jgi:hypothetical protein